MTTIERNTEKQRILSGFETFLNERPYLSQAPVILEAIRKLKSQK